METILAGRINKLFGTGGSVMISLYPTFPEEFDPETTPFIVLIDQLEVPLWCETFERRGQSGAVVAFADMDTDRRAEELLGLEFRLPTEAYDEDEEEEFYLEDLIGFAVEAEEVASTPDTPSVKVCGTLTEYYDSEMNPLFEVEVEGRKVLIPATEEFIAHIDFEQERIHLVLPEGLLNL